MSTFGNVPVVVKETYLKMKNGQEKKIICRELTSFTLNPSGFMKS